MVLSLSVVPVPLMLTILNPKYLHTFVCEISSLQMDLSVLRY